MKAIVIRTRQVGAEVLPLLVALLLVLRVIATPIVLAAPEAGQIALCLNGQITYVDWDGDVPDGSVPHSDPCPFFGVVAVVDSAQALPEVPFWQVIAGAERPVAVADLTSVHLRAAYNSRAPPFSI